MIDPVTIVTYLITGKVLQTAGNMAQDVGEGASKKLGEGIMTYLFKKFPKFGKKMEEAKENPENADTKSLADKLETHAEEDDELMKLIKSLGKELEKQGALVTIDNRKVIIGDDKSTNNTHFGSGDIVETKIEKGEESVKKNGY